MNRDEFIAHIRHIGWVAYQIAADQPYNEHPNEDQFKSLMDGVIFRDDNPDNTPKQNHDNWMKMKLSQGWVYGTVKNFDKKTHPDIVPFEQLSGIEQRKDIADKIVHKLADELWYRI